MPLSKNQNIILAVIVAVFVLGLISHTLNLLNDPIANAIDPFVGLFLPSVKINDNPTLDNKTVSISYTDENSGESLIIKTDKAVYDSFSSAEIYFSATNNRIVGEDFDIAFWFPNVRQDLVNLELHGEDGWEDIPLVQKSIPEYSNRKTVGSHTPSKIGTTRIKARSTVYFKARITFEPMSQGEFFIEAFGSRGGYGHLD